MDWRSCSSIRKGEFETNIHEKGEKWNARARAPDFSVRSFLPCFAQMFRFRFTIAPEKAKREGGRGTGDGDGECIVCQKARPAPYVGRLGRHTNLIGANFADLLSSVRRTNANSRNTGIRSITRTILTLPAGTTRENAGATMARARAPPPQTNCRGVPFIRIQLHVEALTAGH